MKGKRQNNENVNEEKNASRASATTTETLSFSFLCVMIICFLFSIFLKECVRMCNMETHMLKTGGWGDKGGRRRRSKRVPKALSPLALSPHVPFHVLLVPLSSPLSLVSLPL